MKELFIIRHGPAGKSLDDKKLDEARPLTKKGKEKMKEIARGLSDMDISFDKIVTSPLLRCAETADILSKCSGGKKSVESIDALKPGGSGDELIGYLNALDGVDNVAIVGHEPFLSEFASYCLAKSKNSFIDLKKGGVIALEFGGMIKPGAGKICWMMEPSQLIKL
ncbi:MAG TPA: phosphohistidine phosphatase SixA [Methanocellaceae archaeon]|jgi:phosphohistidine phosphatase